MRHTNNQNYLSHPNRKRNCATEGHSLFWQPDIAGAQKHAGSSIKDIFILVWHVDIIQ